MKILVCDDHGLFRAGLGHVLGRLEGSRELIEAGNAEEALRLVALHEAELELVLLDLHMPGMDGWAGLRRLRQEHPGLPVVIVSASERAEDARGAIDGGAAGFIPKQSTPEELLAALRLVLSGGVYVPRLALAAPEAGADGHRQRHRRERAAGLTERQVEVLSLMARGLTNREISEVLKIAEGTVKTHVAAIFDALEVTNRTEAAVLARELGLKAPGEE